MRPSRVESTSRGLEVASAILCANQRGLHNVCDACPLGGLRGGKWPAGGVFGTVREGSRETRPANPSPRRMPRLHCQGNLDPTFLVQFSRLTLLVILPFPSDGFTICTTHGAGVQVQAHHQAPHHNWSRAEMPIRIRYKSSCLTLKEPVLYLAVFCYSCCNRC